MGWLMLIGSVQPWKLALPNAHTSPSDAVNQYPPLSGVADNPTMRPRNGTDPVLPQNCSLPNVNMPPSEATKRYPRGGTTAWQGTCIGAGFSCSAAMYSFRAQELPL